VAARRRDLRAQRSDQRGLLRHHRRQFRVPGSQILKRGLAPDAASPKPNHDHKPDASTDTPQINRGLTGYSKSAGRPGRLRRALDAPATQRGRFRPGHDAGCQTGAWRAP